MLGEHLDAVATHGVFNQVFRLRFLPLHQPDLLGVAKIDAPCFIVFLAFGFAHLSAQGLDGEAAMRHAVAHKQPVAQLAQRHGDVVARMQLGQAFGVVEQRAV